MPTYRGERWLRAVLLSLIHRHFFAIRGPNVDIYFGIIIFGILSVFGILLAVFSWMMSKRLILFIIGLLGNGFVLVCAFLLLFAMGISEP
ncbi:hypothetical protein GN156_15285 [bacterium LRH843]|nr:hypothetical protein [bacterium LRH843]